MLTACDTRDEFRIFNLAIVMFWSSSLFLCFLLIYLIFYIVIYLCVNVGVYLCGQQPSVRSRKAARKDASAPCPSRAPLPLSRSRYCSLSLLFSSSSLLN